MGQVVYVGSTPFVPPGWSGTIEVDSITVGDVLDQIRGAEQVVSYCGHETTAQYLGVDFNRKSVESFLPGQVWVGIRPVWRLLEPGTDWDPGKTPGSFTGWRLRIL
jgi:hypothetical protein